ncbi:hypothetical protein [Actinomadura madurae]|nr:hypothetical protein [Actinomadura madurae]
MQHTERPPTGPRPLLIAMVTVVIGILPDALSLLSDHPVPEALLTACAVIGSTADLLNQVLRTRRPLLSPGDKEKEQPDDQSENPNI